MRRTDSEKEREKGRKRVRAEKTERNEKRPRERERRKEKKEKESGDELSMYGLRALSKQIRTKSICLSRTLKRPRGIFKYTKRLLN